MGWHWTVTWLRSTPRRGGLPVWVFVAALLLWIGSGQATGIAGNGQERPNIIVYLVDTLRADHLGVYGYRRDTSPVLDKWAESSVVFEHAYAPSSWTKPSMVTLFSGLDPVSHGVEDRLDVIPADIHLLAERLKALGYSTMGAVTNPNVLPQWGFDQGFDVYQDLDSAGQGTRADAITNFVTKQIDQLAGKQPFFLYLHVMDPHFPYQPPPPYDTRFPRSRAFPANMSVSRYDGEIAFVDQEFGKLLELLSGHALDTTTMTVFTSDHGEELWDHGGFGHGGNLFEEVVRIPLVIRFPTAQHAGARISHRASLEDVVPTVMRVVNDSSPEGLDGHDLTELLQENQPDWVDREMLLSLRTSGPNSHLVRGLLKGTHKYLRRTRPGTEESLYDIERDPAESKNLASELTDLRLDLAASLDTQLAKRSSGVHFRLVNNGRGDPVDAEALLQTTGRFSGVSGVRLEPNDRFKLSEDGKQLTLNWRLANRKQITSRQPRLVPDEDGIILQVDPPDAHVTVQQLRLADKREIPLRAGPGRTPEILPFVFQATDNAWRIRDVGELLAEAGSSTRGSTPEGYLGVLSVSVQKTAELSKELLERLRSLGYFGGASGPE